MIGELVNPVVTPADLDAGATSNYSLSFNPDSLLSTNQVITIVTGVTGPDYTNAAIESISGGSGLTADLFTPPGNQSIGIEVTGGTATTANTVVIELSGVVNPGAAGAGPDYELAVRSLLNGFTIIAQGTVAGSVFAAVGEPTVTSPIANQNLNEANGDTFVISDLNNVFTDGNGDTLVFSVEAGNDTNVASAQVLGNQLTVTPNGPGVTTITVKASDLPGGEGEVTDSFDVSVIGLMENASFIPLGFDSGVATTYDLNFTSSSNFGDGYVVIISNDDPDGPDYSAATLAAFTANGTPLASNISGQTVDSISVEVTAGTALVNEVIMMSLNGVINPSVGGTGPGYFVRLFRIPTPTGDVEQVSLSGNDFIFGDLIFTNGFETSTLNADAMAKALVATLNNNQPWLPQPSYFEDQQQYVLMGQWLSRDVGSIPRSKTEVIIWFEAVLRNNQPWDDWDGDGQINELDVNPFFLD